jgi:hypothetical protein
MDAQRRATSGRPSMASATKKRGLGSDAPGSSARGSEDRSSVAPPPPPRGTKRAREIEGIDKVCFYFSLWFLWCCFVSRICAAFVAPVFEMSSGIHSYRHPSTCMQTFCLRSVCSAVLLALLQTILLQGGKFALVKCQDDHVAKRFFDHRTTQQLTRSPYRKMSSCADRPSRSSFQTLSSRSW